MGFISPIHYGVTSGIVVDTHMIRLATERLKLTTAKDPVKIEDDLKKIVPQKDWIFFSQSLVLHGRYICVARAPRCWACRLADICPYPDKVPVPPDGKAPLEKQTITGIPIRARRS